VRATALPVIASLLVTLATIACRADREPDRRDVAPEIDVALTPPGGGDGAQPRDGIAAVLLIDVSGSMDDEIRGEGRKIVLARRAALDLVKQFDAYAHAHPAEPVLIGLFKFSDPGETREVLPLSAPDVEKAEAALARLRAHGGTAIGQAMISGKRALDQVGLSRRHLLVVTDGENTDGFAPDDVMTALGKRPEAERPSVYFVAFDIAASRFDGVRNAGGLVLEAANATELTRTLDFLLNGKILVEGP